MLLTFSITLHLWRLLFVAPASGYRNSDAQLCLAIPSLCSLRIPPLPPQLRSRSWRVTESEVFCTSLFLSLCFLRLHFVVTVSGYRNSDARLCLAIPSLCSLRIPPLPPQLRSRSWRVTESEVFCTSLFLSLCFLRLHFVVTVSGYRNSDARLCLAIPSLCSLRIPPLPPQLRSRSWRVTESEVFCTSLFLSLCFLRLLFVVTVLSYRNRPISI